ncbi:glycoside hydrolase family 15 protein [Rhodopirellula europaea]|uniref:glycoside hydrolase family 15 protein n=1 Tax=Rhodopirellula europaea TaxID=1263866 RepID=UPI003D2CCC98|tara:strand:+ start:90 stop:2489 length:2400 start_codon:yes stop_codon:yes gene_type:complete
MTTQVATEQAFGSPGVEPRWTRGNKDAIVTAYSTSSPIWAALSAGIVNEVYFPTIDAPQIRDLQFLLTDGESFFHDERRDTETTIEQLCGDSLCFRVVNRDRDDRYKIEKQIITAPHAACLLLRTKITIAPQWRDRIRVFALLAPHLDIGGCGNTGELLRHNDRLLLTAHRNHSFLMMDCSGGFTGGSCGFVGQSDGWTDLHDNKQLDWQFDRAEDGNVALIGEIDIASQEEFTLAVGFGREKQNAMVAVRESLALPFANLLADFRESWKAACDDLDRSLADQSHDGGRMLHISHCLLLAHEDKTYKGATIASLSIPWGQVKSDKEFGGYHLVWPRDCVNSVTGLMAAGELATPFRALLYLAAIQKHNGGFPQNCWIDGRPHWTGIQLDEVAYPILLAWKLKQADALQNYDPYPMVRSAATYLVREGPATPQDRWEENSGYSPSTLAVHIAALVCAAEWSSQRGEPSLADCFLRYADFLEQHIERWTVTERGRLLEGVERHYIRILPTDPSSDIRPDDPDTAEVELIGQPEDAPAKYPARDIVDAGFLELVRYGVRAPGDPLIEDSLKVVDHVLKVETPFGPCWHRYNRDRHGQKADGSPFDGNGQGRAWPLLTGERAQYELAAGRDCQGYVKAMESFAGPMGLLPEQIWDEQDKPELHLHFGKATGSATPLMWAHSEYIKLLRSLHDGRVYDLIDIVKQRYCDSDRSNSPIEIWKFDSQPLSVRRDELLRIQSRDRFRLRWSDDNWDNTHEVESDSPGLDIHYVDLKPDQRHSDRITFTFYWPDSDRWEGHDFTMEVA